MGPVLFFSDVPIVPFGGAGCNDVFLKKKKMQDKTLVNSKTINKKGRYLLKRIEKERVT